MKLVRVLGAKFIAPALEDDPHGENRFACQEKHNDSRSQINLSKSIIAPTAGSDNAPIVRIGRRGGRNEFGPYDISALSEQFVNLHHAALIPPNTSYRGSEHKKQRETLLLLFISVQVFPGWQ